MGNLKENISSVIKSLKEGEDFISTKTSTDPDTGTISWDIEYKPDLDSLHDEMVSVIDKLKKLEVKLGKKGSLEHMTKAQNVKKLAQTLKRRFNSLKKDIEKIFPQIEEVSSTGQGGASFTPGSGANYATPNAFSKRSKSKGAKNNYYYKMGFKPVPKKIKGSGLEVKQLYENEFTEFHKERINIFDKIEKELNDLPPMISNAKNKTIAYYSENPGSYEIVNSTDLILDYIKDIKNLLKGEEWKPYKINTD